ncbi:MAG: sugar transferase, partial [Candidatus Hodarchaeales archaeon]
PRAERPYFHEKFKRNIPFYKNRLIAKPGIFSLAEVETWNDKMIENVREKVKYDLFFADHQKSFWLNLKIFIKSNLQLFGSKSE